MGVPKHPHLTLMVRLQDEIAARLSRAQQHETRCTILAEIGGRSCLSQKSPLTSWAAHVTDTALDDRWRAIEYPTALQRSRRIHPHRKGLRKYRPACSEAHGQGAPTGTAMGQTRQRTAPLLRVIEAAVLAYRALRRALRGGSVRTEQIFPSRSVGEQLNRTRPHARSPRSGCEPPGHRFRGSFPNVMSHTALQLRMAQRSDSSNNVNMLRLP